jgi:glycyl-tRNA synthetase beta chain
MATFLLELRTEEIPANALAGARQQLRRVLGDRLSEQGLEGCQVRALSTSRRLIALVGQLPARQPERSERVTGPPRSVAFEADGSPTKAAEGFARKLGLEVDQLELDATPKGEYLAATVIQAGRSTSEILAEIVPEAVRGLRFPKMMRWGRGDHEFVRPVHGIVALLDDEVVQFSLFGVESGNHTVGHRVHSPEPFELAHAERYADELSSRQVSIDPEQRRTEFAARADELVSQISCRVHPDEALVAEHVELVEFPGLLRGSFDERFLELPPEVVITTLRHHQKCLVLEGSDGDLAPHFLAVVDRCDDPEGLVRQGNEWVISARLADARFFFEEDRKRSMEDLVPGLERLEFHRRLGSMAAKTARIGELACAVADQIACETQPDVLRRAARLTKVDLLTHMVSEFPELQGVMGGHYLRLEGEVEELWTGVRDHYRPQGFDGELPQSTIGRIVGVADRLDTLAGLFAVGEIPSGSRDPHGLRRAAQGVVRIVVESGWDIELAEVVEGAVTGVTDTVEVDASGVADSVVAFLSDRVRRYLEELVGVAYDTADAVMAARWTRLPELAARSRALENARSTAAFRSLGLAFKRVLNITDGHADGEIDTGLFQQPEEEELHSSWCGFRERLAECLAEGRFDDAFAAMGELAEVLDRFFIEVLVMTDDERIRANRIALLRALRRDFLSLADLSRLQVEGGDE